MTKNSARKKQARAYQAEHPGTRFPEALRAVENLSEDEGRCDGAGPTTLVIDQRPDIIVELLRSGNETPEELDRLHAAVDDLIARFDRSDNASPTGRTQPVAGPVDEEFVASIKPALKAAMSGHPRTVRELLNTKQTPDDEDEPFFHHGAALETEAKRDTEVSR